MTPADWLFAALLEPLRTALRRADEGIAAADPRTPAGRRALAIAYAQVVRHAERRPLGATPPPDLRPGWMPAAWTQDQAGRAWLLARLPAEPATVIAVLDDLAARADLGELVALYQALAIVPGAQALAGRVAEGVRSNIQAVYTAIALDHPLPAEVLDDGAWNQLVLKGFFLGLPTHRIQGWEARANPDLARMLWQYARERRAAGRPVPPGLWRGIAPFADAEQVAALRDLRASVDSREALAGALALAERGEGSATGTWADVDQG